MVVEKKNMVFKRHQKLLKLLELRGELDVDVITAELNASEATVRRDLNSLAIAGKIVRTFGGARISENSSLVVRTFEEKRQRLRREKELIALSAIKFVEPGMVIAIDSGTTAWRILANLANTTPLTILTTALAAVEELGAVSGITINLVGGTFRLQNLDFVGASVISRFAEFHADLAFLSADYFIPGKGAYAQESHSASIGKAIQKCADKTILVVDHEKICNKGLHLVLPSNEIDYLITDDGITSEYMTKLSSEPFKVIVASSEAENCCDET